jgi:hypothetical protein
MFMYCLCEQIKELKYIKQGTICINNLLVEWDDFPIQFSLSLWAVPTSVTTIAMVEP